VAELQGQRINAYPDSAELAADLARTQFTLAGLRGERPQRALPMLHSAFSRQLSAVTLARKPSLIADLAKYGTALVEALAEERDHAAMVRTAGELEADVPSTWNGWPRIAGLLCRGMKLAQAYQRRRNPGQGGRLTISPGVPAACVVARPPVASRVATPTTGGVPWRSSLNATRIG
jgi:hypothetical protein